jgi:hypothetical protein
VRFDAPDSLVREPPDDGREVFLGLADRRDLGFDGIGARQSEGFRSAKEADRRAVSLREAYRCR